MMKRKWLAVGIILLFVGTCLIPAMAQEVEKPLPISRGNWLYVGGSGAGSYDTIQDAIDDANDGDTIFVYDDLSPYYENIYIEKSINLIGEDRNTTVIDGNNYGNVVVVSSYKKVFISGFTIQNSGNYTSPYAWANAGVLLWGAANTIIVGNNIQNNLCGVHLYCSHDNNISGNIISLNEYGIYLPPSLGLCTHNNISGNIIRDNDKGICIKTPENNHILHNNFIHNILYNAHDNCTDFWDGNYWDDYNGTDENHDDIGDTPYNIPGRLNNKDYYPRMNLWINAHPNVPLITGTNQGKPRRMYEYTFNSTDANRDGIYYCIDWGDDSVTGWVDFLPSGQEFITIHKWKRGNYLLRVKAKDIWGAESQWATMEVTMPFSYEPPHFHFIEWLFERFPNAFRSLRYLLDFD